MITSKNYIERRKQLVKMANTDVIVVTGTDLVQKSSDETYDFEQDGYFYYLTGIEHPGWTLVIDVLKGEEFLISTDESSYHNEVWEVKPTHQDVAKATGVIEIKSRRDGWGYLRRECKNYQSIGSIVPSIRFSKSYGMFINPAKNLLIERLKRLHSDANFIDISDKIRDLRAVKEAGELEEIKKAIALTKTGLEIVTNKLSEYDNEAQVYADLAYTFLNVDSGFGYKPVIASGKNTVKLHYKLNNDKIDPGEFLLVDVGATSNRYCADITRTFSVGEVSKRQQDVWDAVVNAQLESLNYLRPGVTMIEHEQFAEQVVGKALNKLGVIDNMLRKNIRQYFPHGIGHHLGIDVHDSCPYDKPLQPGAVITVEPGIYLPDEGIGVRIEDNILITKSGIEVLSKDIPK